MTTAQELITTLKSRAKSDPAVTTATVRALAWQEIVKLGDAERAQHPSCRQPRRALR